jgi:hypothetical protein
MTWPEKIAALKALLKKTGRLWTGTELSGYAADGPYHCGNCRYFYAPNGCGHLAVKEDPGVPHAAGLPVVDAARGCCEFVDPKIVSNPPKREMTPRERALKRRGGQASRRKQGGMSLPIVPWRKGDKEFHRGR